MWCVITDLVILSLYGGNDPALVARSEGRGFLLTPVHCKYRFRTDCDGVSTYNGGRFAICVSSNAFLLCGSSFTVFAAAWPL